MIVLIPPAGGSGSGHVIEDEGTPLTQRDTINFVGAGVAVTDAGGKTVVTIGGGAATPAGSDTQVQFNDAGSFGGDAGLTYVKATDRLAVAGSVIVGDNPPTTDNALVKIQKTLDGNSGPYIGASARITAADTAANFIEGAEFFAMSLPAGGAPAQDLLELDGLVAAAQHNNLRTVDVATGVYAYVQNAAAGTITDAHGVLVAGVFNGAGGTVTRAYGVKIEDITGGVTDYALHTSAGQVLIGQRTGTPATMAAFTSAGVLTETTLAQPIAWLGVGG